VTRSSHLPLAIIVDDSVVEMGYADAYLYSVLGEANGVYDIALFPDSDRAIEFVLSNRERVFMYVQDSTRREGSVIPAWKALRPRSGPAIGYHSHQGDFYTYVIDAFTPEAGAIFAGFSFSTDEKQFISAWSEKDPRIVLADKMGLTLSWKREQTIFHEIALKQLDRWSNHGSLPISSETLRFQPLAEEMMALCGARSEALDHLSSRQFEELVAAIFRNHGFDVELTGATRDGGYDIVATSSTALAREVALVEVKHFAPGRPVGVGIVRSLYGVKTLRRASKAFLVTSSYVSSYASREFERVIPWELEFVERKRILDWCASYLGELIGGQHAAKAEDETQGTGTYTRLQPTSFARG